MMKSYSCVIEYRDAVGTYQCVSDNIENAVIAMVENADLPYITEKRKAKMTKELAEREETVVRINKMRNVWCFSTLVGDQLFMANIVESDVLSDKNRAGADLLQYTVVALYKGGTFIRQLMAKDSSTCLENWARYLSWRHYQEEERKEIRAMVKDKHYSLSEERNMAHLSNQIGGELLRLYIIKERI